MIEKIINLINKIPIKERIKLDGLLFIVEDNSFQIADGGQFVKAQYFYNNSIVFYKNLIKDDEDLKETLLHELSHHFGMNEKQVRNYLSQEK